MFVDMISNVKQNIVDFVNISLDYIPPPQDL